MVRPNFVADTTTLVVDTTTLVADTTTLVADTTTLVVDTTTLVADTTTLDYNYNLAPMTYPARQYPESMWQPCQKVFICEFPLCYDSILYKVCISQNTTIQNVSKRALQLSKRIEIYTEDIHNVLNCQNVAKHTEFYLE
jgi:hypothetical protein